MTDLLDSAKEGLALLRRKDDDVFDRLSNRYTIGFLIAASLFLASKNYVGNPIDCWVPKEFDHGNGNKNWIQYTDNYCWIKNTYYVAYNQPLLGPKGLRSPDHSSGKELPYYQWVPIILAFMILSFGIPVAFWRFSMWSSGYDIQAIIDLICGADNLDPEKRDETTTYIVAQLDRHITYHRHLDSQKRIPLGNKYGRYLYFMYVITKCLYTAVPVVLLYLLSLLMGEGYLDYGIQAVKSLYLENTQYVENPMFPRVTFCDFAIRKMGGNIHRYTVQCVLTVNLFNEKTFLVIWWWLLILAALSALGLLVCLLKALRPNGGYYFVSKYLELMKVIKVGSTSDQRLVSVFASQYLCLDGVFCMRLLSQNTTDVYAAEIIAELFKRWKTMHSGKMRNSGRSIDSSK